MSRMSATGESSRAISLQLPQKLLVVVFLALGASYMVWRTTTFNPEAPIFSALLYAAELYGFINVLIHTFITWSITERHAAPPPPGLKVDVFVPTYNEPVDIVRRTLMAAVAMDYPHRTVLLDDGRRPEMEELARSLGCRYLARPTNEHAKAGNLNFGLDHSDAEFIALFDADHAPHRSFLVKTLGFFADQKVAFVQTPQDFYNLDSFQHRLNSRSRLVWTEQSLFFRVIQRGKDRSNSAFFCGSCAVVRRSAIDHIGGFATETITEDMHTSMRLHMEGYRSVYFAESLAFGIAPATVGPFLNQRLRWGQGAMQIWRKEGVLLNRRLTLSQRLNYFANVFNYFEGWQKAIFYAVPAVTLITGVLPLSANGGEFLWHFLPYFLLGIVAYEELGRGYGHFILTEQYSLARFATFAGSTLGLLRNNLRFVVTSKKREKAQKEHVMPHKVVLVVNAIAIPAGLLVNATLHPLSLDAFVVAEFWAIVNVALGVSFLAFARQTASCKRNEYRFRIPVSATISFPGAGVERVTIDDLSVTGFSFYGKFPPAISKGSRIEGELSLPSGPMPFTATIRSHQEAQIFDGTQLIRYVRSVGCEFNTVAEVEQARLERFLYGSDLQWRANGWSESATTPMEKLFGRKRDTHLSLLGQRTWTASEITIRNPGVRVPGVLSNESGDVRHMLVPGNAPLSGELMISVHSRSGVRGALGTVSEVEVIETAEGPLNLITVVEFSETQKWEELVTAPAENELATEAFAVN